MAVNASPFSHAAAISLAGTRRRRAAERAHVEEHLVREARDDARPVPPVGVEEEVGHDLDDLLLVREGVEGVHARTLAPSGRRRPRPFGWSSAAARP
jgi:hypothetical protein